MSYSTSQRAIQRVQVMLDEMMHAESECRWTSKNSVMLAYHLREAMKAASRHEAYKKYATLREKFVIRVQNSEVVAEPRVQSAIEGVKLMSRKITLDDVTEVAEVLGAAAMHKVEELHLPNFSGGEEELTKLFRWTEANKLYIISHYGAGITITRKNPGASRWTPKS